MLKKKLVNKIIKEKLYICAAESITGGKFTSEIVKNKGASSSIFTKKK